MRIVFFGTGEFALPALKRLMKSGHEIAAVVTQPDRKRGRGWNVRPTPVKAFAEQVAPGIAIFQPERTSEEEFTMHLKDKNADLFVVIDYGQLLDKEVLQIPRKYCVNLHPSILPKYRGASPVNWAILNGEDETGNTVIRMDARMDAGNIILQETIAINSRENADDLEKRLSATGAELVIKALELIEAGKERFLEQDEKKATYAPKLKKEQGEVSWEAQAAEVIRKIRGMQPWPGAFTYLDGRCMKITEAVEDTAEAKGAKPGAVLNEKTFVVNTGEGAVRISRVQLDGKKVMTTEEFLRGHKLSAGTVLG